MSLSSPFDSPHFSASYSSGDHPWDGDAQQHVPPSSCSRSRRELHFGGGRKAAWLVSFLTPRNGNKMKYWAKTVTEQECHESLQSSRGECNWPGDEGALLSPISYSGSWHVFVHCSYGLKWKENKVEPVELWWTHVPLDCTLGSE